MHLDLDDAVPLARFASSAVDIEREPPRLIAARFGFRQLREQVADMGEDPGVGGRVGTGRSADRRLVDIDHLVDMLQPSIVSYGSGVDGIVKFAGQNRDRAFR